MTNRAVHLCCFFLLTLACRTAHAEVAFPGTQWDTKPPAELGLNGESLARIESELGGRGCIIRDGYVVHAWGDQSERGDWLSSAKPVLSTLLFFALEEGLVSSVDQPVADFDWPLNEKDRGITFRHLGSMTSGYARPEGPGASWAYNDFAIQLYQQTLFDRVFKADPKEVAESPQHFGALGLQDGLKFSDKRRIAASVRDFARIAWFWMNRGRWGHRQVLPAAYFNEFMKPQTQVDLPHTQDADTDDYLNIGSFGGGSDHFTRHGAGIYGFNWWFNAKGGTHPDARTWPAAPPDSVMSIGAGGNCTAMMPGLGLLLVCAKGDWGKLDAGDESSKMNRVLGLLAESAGYNSGPAELAGTLREWHPLTLSFSGPETAEDAEENPFTNYRLSVTFTCNDQSFVVPGFFAADGNAAESAASQGSIWKVRFTPDREGEWSYAASFRKGDDIACSDNPDAGEPLAFDGASGSFVVRAADPDAPGFLRKGELRYVGTRYLQFAETGEYYLKGGADSPENLLAFVDFDDTKPSHRFEPHARDWRLGDPTWRGGKGKNLIGALNYLASKRMNCVYFLTMNVKGDGKDVWPWTNDGERFRFDCSKLDQWDIVFNHMDRIGLLLHVVLQEQENDQLLDKGDLGPQRKLYLRELIARFAHHPALEWNFGEENTNTHEQRLAISTYIRDLDPYDHPIVMHTFPSEIDEVYPPLLGVETIEGPSLQLGNMERTHRETREWIGKSEEAGRPWFVCIDEIGPADTGVVPDADDPNHDTVRRHALWGNLMAGGAGAEWLFGYKYAHNDINCEDWRSRDRMWEQTAHGIEFFQKYLPFTEMKSADDRVQGEGVWCFANPGKVYAVYLPSTEGATLELPDGAYSLDWYNPRDAGDLIPGPDLSGPGVIPIGPPPTDADRDWVALIRTKDN